MHKVLQNANKLQINIKIKAVSPYRLYNLNWHAACNIYIDQFYPACLLHDYSLSHLAKAFFYVLG